MKAHKSFAWSVVIFNYMYMHPPRMWKVGCSNPSRDKPKAKEQVVTAPLPNAGQQV